MHYTIYPEIVQVRFHGRIPAHIRPMPIHGITSYPRRNRRRSSLPLLVLTFILGLLAGWMLRGGGVGLP